jgi:hypothetical protein
MEQRTVHLGPDFYLLIDVHMGLEADLLRTVDGSKVCYLTGGTLARWTIDQPSIQWSPKYDEKFKESSIEILNVNGVRLACLLAHGSPEYLSGYMHQVLESQMK